MASTAEHQESIWENTRRILGANPAPDFERIWDATVESQTGAAALRLLSVEPPTYHISYAGDMDEDGMMLSEQYTFGQQGVIASVARINVSGFEVFTLDTEERLHAQLGSPISEPGTQDYARLAEILSQGPTSPTPPEAGQ